MTLEKILSGVVGMDVSHVWFSDYSVVYFELGLLTASQKIRRDGSVMNPTGQVTIYAGYDWRIERENLILCSRDCEKELRHTICKNLKNFKITEVSVFGRIPELSVGFSNDVWLATFGLSKGDPDWSVTFNEQSITVFAEQGKLVTEKENI